jgi:hypothetical protein
MRREDEEGQEITKVPIRVAPISQGISTVTSITCTVDRIVINNIEVPVSGGTIELEPDKAMTIKVHYTASAPGAGYLDSWHIGITAKMGSQFGWDPTRHTGSGPISIEVSIGNLKAPSTSQTLVIKWYGIAGSYSAPPPG